jgi:hypothetical protein
MAKDKPDVKIFQQKNEQRGLIGGGNRLDRYFVFSVGACGNSPRHRRIDTN